MPIWKIVFGYCYLAVISVVFYRYAVRPRFAEYMMREMGCKHVLDDGKA